MDGEEMSMAGLIKREVVAADLETVTVRETWDLKVPGCPMIAVRLSPFGIDDDATTLVHEFTMPVEQ
jgi:hypothetical protein